MGLLRLKWYSTVFHPHATTSAYCYLFLVAHKIYGIPQTINTANYVYFLAYQELFGLRSSAAASTSQASNLPGSIPGTTGQHLMQPFRDIWCTEIDVQMRLRMTKAPRKRGWFQTMNLIELLPVSMIPLHLIPSVLASSALFMIVLLRFFFTRRYYSRIALSSPWSRTRDFLAWLFTVSHRGGVCRYGQW